jgi:hypothetical protein
VQILADNFCGRKNRGLNKKTRADRNEKSGNYPGKRVAFLPHFKGAHAVYDHHRFVIKLNFNACACIMFPFYFFSAAAVSSSV